MEFVDYMKEMMKKIEAEKGACRVKMGEDEFVLHEECFCDFHKDFVIMYDKRSEVSLVTRYEAIQTLQYMPQHKLDNIEEELLSELKSGIFKALMED